MFSNRNRGQTVELYKRFPLTLFLLFLCTLLFIITSREKASVIERDGEAVFQVGRTPTYRALCFDFPQASEELLQFALRYPLVTLDRVNQLTGKASDAYHDAVAIPKWEGLYSYALQGDQVTVAEIESKPMFEKIEKGQVWRFFTPVLLHASLLHLLFNMSWLWSLGLLIEMRIGSTKFFFMVLLIALFSNCAQYLMSGPMFVGFSGVACGILGFIWMRQKIAPWDGYPLPLATFFTALLFIGIMVLLQLIAFIGDLFNIWSFRPGIANTAHIVGGLTGIVIGMIPYFGEVSE